MPEYSSKAPERAEVDKLPGATLIEFGTPWCGHCARAQPLISAALQDQPALRHLKIEDGPGRKLGRSYRVKLWPTLIFLKDGTEVARVVRPQGTEELRQALSKVA